MQCPCMDYADRAVHVILDAEKAMRQLMTEALKGESYRDLALVAPFADRLVEIRRDLRPAAASLSPVLEASGSSLRRGTKARKGRAAPPPSEASEDGPLRQGRSPCRPVAEEPAYPRFEREVDRLVKVGWSKRDGRVYEHKAPKAAVFLFVRKVQEAVLPGAVFSMERLLPVVDEQGDPQPSYQAYLALAWLRSVRTVERRTKDGYMYAAGALDAPNVERLWAALPEKK